MPFVVEDGTGLSQANAYASVADADVYFADRGNSEWLALASEQKEFALVNASEYIDVRWGPRFQGRPLTSEQSLRYPRVSWCVRDSQVPASVPLPMNLIKATFQYALIASTTTLAPNPQQDASGMQPSYVREKVGPLEEERRWADTSTAQVTLYKDYPVADSLIATLLALRNGSRVMR